MKIAQNMALVLIKTGRYADAVNHLNMVMVEFANFDAGRCHERTYPFCVCVRACACMCVQVCVRLCILYLSGAIVSDWLPSLNMLDERLSFSG